MFSNEDIQQMGSLPSAERQKLTLAPGDDVEGSPWRNLYNIRLKVDGQYVFWKTRGGSTVVNSFFGNVLTINPFEAIIGGISKEYLAVHTAAGHVYLWDIQAGTSNEIANSTFSTTEQIQFALIGNNLFMFDYDGGAAKYYDLVKETLYDFLSYDKSYIYSASYIREEDPDEHILDFEIGNSIIVFPNAEGLPNFVAYESKIKNAKPEGTGTRYYYETPEGEQKSTVIGGVASDSFSEKDLIFPHTPDTDPLVGQASNKEESGSNIAVNEAYTAPAIYRQYVIVDILNDGSVTLPGKPYQIEVSEEELLDVGVNTVTLNVTSASANVARRYLCATRWQPSATAAFKPSTPEYSNGALFIVKEVSPNSQVLTDNTPDPALLQPLGQIVPSNAGVPDLFGADEISPNSIAPFTGSLMIAGYRINRPTPAPYAAPQNETDGNIFMDITTTSPLPNNMKLSFQFEYTDGKKSQIVDTEQLLQKGSTVETQPVACDQAPAAISHTVTSGVSEDGILTVTYDGYSVEIPLTLASHSTPGEVASAIQQAVDNSDLRLSATLTSSDTIEYTELRYGEEFNGNIVDVGYKEVAAEGYIDVTAKQAIEGDHAEGYVDVIANNLVQSPSSGHIDVTANNLASGATEDHTINIGGTTTNPITITDTDTLEGIVDKYITEINSSITGWTASKVDNGDGTWRCLIESDTNDESLDGTTISVTGNTDVSLSINSPTAGGNDGEETHVVDVGGNTTANITVLYTDTIETIAQKYVDAINADANINTNWTASKVDNGDGTWRCLITADSDGTTWNNTTIAVNGATDVSVSTTNATGGTEGSEDHQITVGANTTAPITIADADTIEIVAQKYVDAINADANINTNWTASKVDNGDGTWRCLITADNKGSSYNGTTLDVTGNVAVTVSETTPTGGLSAPGVTFDVRDPQMAGAQDPIGTPAEGYIYVNSNNVGAYDDSMTPYIGNVNGSSFSVAYEDTKNQIINKVKTALEGNTNITDDWEFVIDSYESYELVYVGGADGDPDKITNYEYQWVDINYLIIRSKESNANWNDVKFGINSADDVDFSFRAPGKESRETYNFTAGGDVGCTQSTASITADANNLTGTEDHTLTVAGVNTDPVTIDDTMTLNDIALAWQSAIEGKKLIDQDWEAVVDGATLTLRFRIHGTLGNGKELSISGNTNVPVTISSPSAGGEDAGEVPEGDATQINANRMQIHSLNQLVSRVFVIGRTNTTDYHLIRSISITDPEAHGKVIDLPNSEAALNEIEATTYLPPSNIEVLESVDLEDHVNIGTPYQQFQISTQENIVDKSRILRAMPIDFANDTTVMRYRVMLFTNRNIQMGYLVDQTQTFESGQTRRTFEGDFETVLSGMKINSREGVSDILGQTIIPTENGIYSWSRDGGTQRLFNADRYGVSANNKLIDATYNPNENELWFIFRNSEVVVYDFETQSSRRMEYNSLGAIRAGAFFEDKLYIGSGTDVLETDVDGATTDTAGGATVTAKAETAHIGNELSQMRLLELVVGGQAFNCSVDIDLQPERFEGDPATWSKSFQADKSITAKTLKMHGASFQVQRMAVMPRLRLSFDAATGGFLSHVILKSVPTDNRGKARQ